MCLWYMVYGSHWYLPCSLVGSVVLNLLYAVVSCSWLLLVSSCIMFTSRCIIGWTFVVFVCLTRVFWSAWDEYISCISAFRKQWFWGFGRVWRGLGMVLVGLFCVLDGFSLLCWQNPPASQAGVHRCADRVAFAIVAVALSAVRLLCRPFA